MVKIKNRNIIIMGPQGSGKSTQAQMLAKKLGLKHISTGRTFREIAKEDSKLGRKIRNYLDKGLLISHKRVMEVINTVVPKEGFVLEGSPRELHQAKEIKHRIDKVIYIHTSDEEGIRRIMKGTKIAGKGVSRKGRGDDTPKALKKRLALFHERTEPVLDFYRRKGILVEIEGERSIEEVFKSVLEVL